MENLVCAIICDISGNGGKFLFSTDFIQLIVTKSGLTVQFSEFTALTNSALFGFGG